MFLQCIVENKFYFGTYYHDLKGIQKRNLNYTGVLLVLKQKI